LELLLNLVWLGVTACIAAAFAVYALRHPGRASARMALTLACVAALLFPIISMTDDLAATTAALEEWSAMRRTVLVVLIDTPLLAQTAERIGAAVLRVCAVFVVLDVIAVLSPATTTVWSFRAPPFAQA
jgi:hypothetical protein